MNASDYFNSIGYPCPPLTNPAEHFMKIMSSETLTNRLDDKQLKELEELDDNHIQERYKDRI